MYHLINRNAGAVIGALRHIGVREYLQLRKDLETNGAHMPSTSYQAAYRKYWRMNAARLSPLFYERYFKLLAECRASGIMDLAQVTRIISDPYGADHTDSSFRLPRNSSI